MKHHFEDICQDKTCRSFVCKKRHPRVCYFYSNFRNCKFGDWCRYLHENIEPVEVQFRSNYEDIKNLENELKNLKTELESKVKDLKKQNDETDKLTEKVLLLERENKKLHEEIKEKKQEEDPTDNNEVKKLKERVVELEIENNKFFDNEPYKKSLNGTRINMNNVKKSFEKVKHENEALKTEVVELRERNSNRFKEVADLKERNAKIFEALREQTKKWGEGEHEIILLKKRLGEYISDDENESESE